MTQRIVNVFTISTAVKAKDMDWVEFVQAPQFRAERDNWSQPFNAQDFVVRHIEPVLQVQMPNGERHYVAMEPRLFELLGYAVEPEMARRLSLSQSEIKTLSADVAQVSRQAADERRRAERWAEDYSLANKKLADIAGASLLQRIKYLFTGSFK